MELAQREALLDHETTRLGRSELRELSSLTGRWCRQPTCGSRTEASRPACGLQVNTAAWGVGPGRAQAPRPDLREHREAPCLPRPELPITTVLVSSDICSVAEWQRPAAGTALGTKDSVTNEAEWRSPEPRVDGRRLATQG